MTTAATAVQRLVKACERQVTDAVLHNPGAITAELIAPILHELSYVTKDDLRLAEPWHWAAGAGGQDAAAPVAEGALAEAPSLLAGKAPKRYYLHIAETECYSIGVFILPPGAAIPMHDHPRMCVLSKVLYGNIKVWSYDWTDYAELDQNRANGGEAQVVDDARVFPEGSIKMLFPSSGGNLHQFLAPDGDDLEKALSGGATSASPWPLPSSSTACPPETGPAAPPTPALGAQGVGCAILDVILPPYDDSYRNCTYYAKQALPGNDKIVRLTPDSSRSFVIENLIG